jgi:hypothetical protein
VYRPVRCLFEFALLQMYRIFDVHLLLYSCAAGQGRLNGTERTIFHWSINHDLKRVIHITRHNCRQRFCNTKFISQGLNRHSHLPIRSDNNQIESVHVYNRWKILDSIM